MLVKASEQPVVPQVSRSTIKNIYTTYDPKLSAPTVMPWMTRGTPHTLALVSRTFEALFALSR